MHFNVHASSLALSLLSHWLEGCCIIHEKFASTLISHYITPATALQPSHHLSAPLCTLCTIVHTTAQSHALYVQTKRYRFFSFNSCLAISAVQTRHILFMDQDKVEVHKHAKKKIKEQGQCPAILTEQAWPIKDLFYEIKHQNMIYSIFLIAYSPYPDWAI